MEDQMGIAAIPSWSLLSKLHKIVWSLNHVNILITCRQRFQLFLQSLSSEALKCLPIESCTSPHSLLSLYLEDPLSS
jgi:hypothetical protein